MSYLVNDDLAHRMRVYYGKLEGRDILAWRGRPSAWHIKEQERQQRLDRFSLADIYIFTTGLPEEDAIIY